MKDTKRHQISYRFLRKLITPVFKWMFNYHYPIVDQVKEPYIVLANHNMELDPALLGMAFPKPMYFVASEHILRKGFGGWFLMHFLNPIIRKKGKVEVRTVAEVLRRTKAGHNICIFAEGARSFNGLTCDILPSTGKLVQRSGCSLITYRLEGGYFTQPRWSTTLRKGKIQGIVAGIYSAEEVAKMTEDEINTLITKDLFEDAYETQAKNPIAYKGKHLALGMESTLFQCPKCNTIGTLHSDDTSIFCECGAKFLYTEYGDLVASNGDKFSITDWDLWQQESLAAQFEKRVVKQDTAALFSDPMTLYYIDKNHQVIETLQGTLTAYTDRLECCGKTFFYEEMLGLDIFSRNFIIMNYGKEAIHYEMKGDSMFCALKYLYLYRLAKGETK